MNGSNHAAGRQGPASALGLSPLSVAEEALLQDGSWPWSSHGRCLLCRLRQETTASCERDQRVLDVLERRRAKPLIVSGPPRVVVCKDCCIAALDGHRCPWWDLCWRE